MQLVLSFLARVFAQRQSLFRGGLSLPSQCLGVLTSHKAFSPQNAILTNRYPHEPFTKWCPGSL